MSKDIFDILIDIQVKVIIIEYSKKILSKVYLFIVYVNLFEKYGDNTLKV